MLYLGIDTSNYTTSLALYDSNSETVIHQKKLLPVKEGQLGLRQSDAVFHHTRQLPELAEQLFCVNEYKINAIGVSTRPRNIEGSYMPCFLAGEAFAREISAINKIPLYKTSHQVGHILAAAFSAKKIDLLSSPFIAFHVSGGTTDCLLVEPDDENVIKISEIGSSKDLKAGQVIDRVGLMLGLKFPCGKELEKLALKSDKEYKIKPVLKGTDCCLSGIENKCAKMLSDDIAHCDIAKFCLDSVCSAVFVMTEEALKIHNKLPVLYAGGVMSDRIIRDKLEKNFDSFFAEPEYSCDNASGVALYAKIMEDRNG